MGKWEGVQDEGVGAVRSRLYERRRLLFQCCVLLCSVRGKGACTLERSGERRANGAATAAEAALANPFNNKDDVVPKPKNWLLE